MKNQIVILLLSLFCVVGRAQVPGAKIESVGLFKNGLAVVHLSGAIPEGGKLELDDLPQPVHGTFAITSEKPVTARVELRQIDKAPGEVTQAELLQNLTGQKVTLYLEKDTISGEVMGAPQKKRRQWERDYLPQENSYHFYSGGIRISGQSSGTTLIKTAEGRMVAVMSNQIQRIEFGEMPKVQQERPVFSLNSAAPGWFEMEYLAKGISWVPSYRIDLADPKTLSVTQSAVIRNELADLSDVEIRLISGFPSVKFGAVDSPLSAQVTWKSFFDQLANRSSQRYSTIDNSGISQQIGHGSNNLSANLGAADEGESVDLHYQSIGRHTLGIGEAFSTDVAKAETTYQRVVEWNVPDTRTVDGRTIPDHEWQEKMDLTPWDAIVFKNPFTFPMTTGPALVVKGADFQGQQLATWTNPGSETSIRINKALSLSTRSMENEVPDSRVEQRLGGSRYYRVKVKGELTVKNHRGNPAAMVIRRQFSGNLVEAALNPTSVLLESGVYSVNKRNEFKWSLELKPGEEKSLTYLYEVLVRD